MIRQLRRAPGPLLGVLAFTCVSLLLTSLVAGTLRKGAGTDPTTYKALFTDASGLKPGDDVRMAGVRVGRVESRELVGTLAKVTFTVDGVQPVYADALAEVSFLNLLGQRYLKISPPPKGDGPTLDPGGTIPVEHTRPAIDLTAIFNAFKPLFDTLRPADVNQLMEEVVAVLQGEGPRITHLLRQTARLTNHLADRDAVIGRVLTNMTAVMETTAANRTELATMIDDLGTLVHGLAGDRATIGAAIEGMQELSAATGDLLTRGRDPLASDIAHLRSLSATLAGQSGALARALRSAPMALGGYARAMGYGSWLNVYICNLSIQTPDGRSVLRDDVVPSKSEVCR